MKEKIRTHDKIYLKSNRYNEPKEYFKLFHTILKKKIKKNKNYELLDVGCANGELLFYLEKKFRNISFSGVDIRDDLIKLAKKKLSHGTFLERKNFNRKISINKKYDFVVCCGVISIFDDLDIFIKNLKKSVKKNGSLFIFNTFNEYDFDLVVSYRDLNSKIESYQSGWNLWSIKTIQRFFKKKVKKHKFHIKFDIKKNKKDLMRTWTLNIDKKRHFVNALQIIQNQMFLEIKI